MADPSNIKQETVSPSPKVNGQNSKKTIISPQNLKKAVDYVAQWLDQSPNRCATKIILLAHVNNCKAQIWLEEPKKVLNKALKWLESEGHIKHAPKGKTYYLKDEYKVTPKKRKRETETSADEPKKKKQKQNPAEQKVETTIGYAVLATANKNANCNSAAADSMSKKSFESSKWADQMEVLNHKAVGHFFYKSANPLIKTKRIALVIGNADYDGQALPVVFNDVRGVGEKLLEIGFDLTLLLNAPRKAIESSLRSFLSPEENCIKFLFYAGSGEEDKESNRFGICTTDKQLCLLPSLATVNNGSVIMVLNTYKGKGQGKTEQNGTWIGPTFKQKGYFLEFACTNQKAKEDGQKGLFAKHLIAHLKDNLALPLMFQEVRTSMLEDTSANQENIQLPIEHSTLTGKPIVLLFMDY